MAAALSVPKRFVLANLGTAHFNQGSGVGDPGNFKTFITETVPIGLVRVVTQVVVTCNMEGYFQILAGGQLIGSGMTCPSQKTVPFGFDPGYQVNENLSIQIQFRQRSKCPPAQVDVFLQAADVIP